MSVSARVQAAAAQQGTAGDPPLVSALANGRVNSILDFVSSTCDVGVQFNTDGDEYEQVSLGAYSANVGQWLDQGTSAQVWVAFTRTAGISKWDNKTNGVRYNIASSQNFTHQRNGTGLQTLTGFFVFYDAASGGSTLQTTSSASWTAEVEFDPCPLCCFTPCTLITMADGLPKQIGHIGPGEMIRVEGGIEPVDQVLVRVKRAMYRITFSDDRILELSEDHPIHIEHRGYCCINPIVEYKDIGISEKLEIGDNATTVAGDSVRIEEIEPISYEEEVYTFSNSRFYANGILVY